jgi:hypothetical protein
LSTTVAAGDGGFDRKKKTRILFKVPSPTIIFYHFINYDKV